MGMVSRIISETPRVRRLHASWPRMVRTLLKVLRYTRRVGQVRVPHPHPQTLERDSVWVALGLLVALAAAWRVLATPGEIIQGDLGYPFAGEFWTRPYTSAWDTSYGSSLVSVLRTYTYMPWGLVVQAFGLSAEVASKFHWLSWHLLGFLAGYVGMRMLVGPELRTSHPRRGPRGPGARGPVVGPQSPGRLRVGSNWAFTSAP